MVKRTGAVYVPVTVHGAASTEAGGQAGEVVRPSTNTVGSGVCLRGDSGDEDGKDGDEGLHCDCGR